MASARRAEIQRRPKSNSSNITRSRTPAGSKRKLSRPCRIPGVDQHWVSLIVTDGRHIMSTKKVIEVLSESPDSWEAAAQKAVDDASQNLRGIASVYVKEFEARVENNRVSSYRINAKVTFEVEKT